VAKPAWPLDPGERVSLPRAAGSVTSDLTMSDESVESPDGQGPRNFPAGDSASQREPSPAADRHEETDVDTLSAMTSRFSLPMVREPFFPSLQPRRRHGRASSQTREPRFDHLRHALRESARLLPIQCALHSRRDRSFEVREWDSLLLLPPTLAGHSTGLEASG